MVIARHYLPWWPLLVLVAIASQLAALDHGPDLVRLFNGFQADDGSRHHSTLPSVTQTAGMLPDWRRSTETPAADTWTRLRNGFSLPAERTAAVQTQLKRYASDPGNIERILQRGRPYLYHILNSTRQRGLPAELALIPVIESAFDPFAHSSQGAAGLWQFMPATARELGLQQNDWYDGRLDVITATEAALDYLTRLQQRFDGDWLLALAAYNAGSARVQKAIQANRKRGKPVDFWHLPLPRETRQYVPKLLALRTLLLAPADYGLALPAMPAHPYFTAIDTGGQLDLAVAARLAGISVDEIRWLNPGYTRMTIHHDGPHALLIPGTQVSLFRTRLARLPEDQRIQWVHHRIRAGDTLSTIARRYRTTVSHLRSFNRLPDSRIIAGDLLIVPVAQG